MESNHAQADPDRTIFLLVDALQGMRNALIKASLMLQDFQFDLDSVQHSVAVENSKKLIETVKLR